MRKTIAFILAMALVLCLAACANEQHKSIIDQYTSNSESQNTGNDTPDNTPEDNADAPADVQPEQPEEDLTPPQEEQPEPPVSKVPYITDLSGATPIYSGPGYDYSFVQTVGQSGPYTIVEETGDTAGNLWGKLKSGIGWVVLIQNAPPQPSATPLYAAYADEVPESNCHLVIIEDSDYTVKIGFWASEPLSNVQFSRLEYAANSYRVSQVLHVQTALTPDRPLVTWVSFPGDLTTYGISFIDGNGYSRSYAVYTSGADGSLILEEYQ